MTPLKYITAIYNERLVWLDPIPSYVWAAENINYRNALNYDTPYKGRFNADLMPFWKDVLDEIQNRSTREVAVLKCSRAGYSENCVLTDLRYTMAEQPEPTFYITGLMDLALGFMDRRVKRGMNLCDILKKKYRRAHCVDQDVRMPDMDFRSTWCTSNTAVKQDGWSKIYCDEVSLWKEFTIDMVRRRCAAYPFHHIVFGGSIDPERRGDPDADPMLKLYEESDKRIWMMPDPTTGNLFYWHMDGVKWPETCRKDEGWNLEAVLNSSWYETPDGTRIDEADRMDVTRSGQWVSTSTGTRAGFKVVAPMVPFADCSFGNLAKQFLSAKYRLDQTAKKMERNRNTIRTYFAEYWAEAKREEMEQVQDSTLAHLEHDYELKNVYVTKGYQHGIYVTADVQKYHIWQLAHVWAMDPKTGKVETSLLDFGTSATFDDFDAWAAEREPAQTGIDVAYDIRASEVTDYCSKYTDQKHVKEARVFALRGSDAMQKTILDYQVRDAREGKSKAGKMNYLELVWSTDVFRTWFVEMLNGLGNVKLALPDKWVDEKMHREYIRQVPTTRKVDGEWLAPGHRQDHLFDCTVMQVVLARWDGLIQ